MSAVARARGGFLYEVSLTFGARVVGLVVTILASVIAARALGPSGKGALAVIGLIASLAVQFGDLGFHASNTYLWPANHRPCGESPCFPCGSASGWALSCPGSSWLPPGCFPAVSARFLKAICSFPWW